MTFLRAQYLSQQFVEELCSAKGVSDGLVDEIERVIFESHSQDDREWALDFAYLRDQQTSRFPQAREREARCATFTSIGQDLQANTTPTPSHPIAANWRTVCAEWSDC